MKRRRCDMKTDGRNQDLEIDNSQDHFSAFSTLFSSGRLSDVTLRVGSKENFVEYRAHKMVLCAYSDVFEIMLTDPNWLEPSQSTVTLVEDEPAVSAFPLFLRYFYTGKIKFAFPFVLPVLTLADKYNVRELSEICLNFMKDRIVCAVTNKCLISWYQYAEAVGHDSLLQDIRNHVLWNFEQVARCDDFDNFEPHILVGLLHENELVITNELALFECVSTWLSAYEARLRKAGVAPDVEIHMEEVIQTVMNQIRFPMMSPRQLAEMLLKDIVTKYKEYFVERLAMGMSFHSGQVSRVITAMEREPGGASLFAPRLYTEEKWCTSVAIEQFPCLPSYYSRTMVFQSPTTASEECTEVEEKQWEWTVEVYPKGVWFKKFYLIGWERMQEVPDHVMKTIRVSLKRKERQPKARVRVGLLVHAESEGGVEYIKKAVIRRAIFDDEVNLLNFDDVMPFEELNPNFDVPGASRGPASGSSGFRWPPRNDPNESSSGGGGGDGPAGAFRPAGDRPRSRYDENTRTYTSGGGPYDVDVDDISSNYIVGPQRAFKLQVIVTPVQDRLLSGRVF